MRVVYIAGPFRSTNVDGTSNSWGIQQHVMHAMALALEVWKRGAVAICPHANTMFFQRADGIDDATWLTGDLELVKRSDAVLVTNDWEQSSGARGEVAVALDLEKPVLYSLEELDAFLAGFTMKESA